jgi:hypothetical protein
VKLQSLSVTALLIIALSVVGFMCWLAYLAHDAGSDLGAAGWITAALLTLRSAMGMIESIAMGHRRNEAGEDDPDANHERYEP